MCEYCDKRINNKPIKCIDEDIDKSKLTLIKINGIGYTIFAEIDNIADDNSNIPDIADQYFEINYCPMCGRKLEEILNGQSN